MITSKIIGVETINTCNARCPFCPLFQGDSVMSREVRPAKIMDQAMFTEIVAQIVALESHPDEIFLNMDGEPLQDPLFPKRLEVIAAAGLAPLVTLQTNAQFLDASMAEAILTAGIGRIVIGFDGATEAVYEAHRVRCDYHRVLDNIRRFVSLRQAAEAWTHLSIVYVRTEQNRHEVAAAYALFKEFLDPDMDVFHDNPSKDWGDSSGPDGLFIRSKQMTGANPRGCRIFDEQFIIHSDGKVAACCYDYNLSVSDGGLGHVADDGGMEAIWNGDRRNRLGQAINSSEIGTMPEKCRSCVNMYDAQMPSLNDAQIADLDLVSVSEYGLTYRFPHRDE